MNSKQLLILIGIAALLVSSAGLVYFKFVLEDQYDPDFAKKASIFAWASRCSVANLESWTCGTPCEMNSGVIEVKAFYNATHQIQGYTAYDLSDDLIVVSFRATDTNLNWLLDFDFFKINYDACSGCQVHRGFLIGWKDLQQSVLSATRELSTKYPTAKIAVVGHSLGGALAILASVDINSSVKHVDYVYTFGQPRVGNQQFANYFNENIGNIYRLIHNRDLIPHLPLQSQGFYHEGTEVWYNEESTSYQVCAYEQEDKTCSDQLKDLTMSDHDDYLGRDISASC